MYFNLARVTTASTGDSDIILGDAVPGCKTFADAGAVDSGEYEYAITTYSLSTHRPIGSETGIGKYISAGTTFKRNAIESSTDSDNSAIDLTGLSEIFLAPIASRANRFAGIAVTTYSGTDSFISDATATFSIDTELSDDNNYVSIISDSDGGNKLQVANAGWYDVLVSVEFESDSDFVLGEYFVLVLDNSGPIYSSIQKPYFVGPTIFDFVGDISQTVYLAANGTLRARVTNKTAQTIQGWIIEFTIKPKIANPP